MQLRTWKPGDVIPLGTRHCTLAKFRLYSGTKASHHTDYVEAAKVGLKRPLAPGVMTAAHVYETLTDVYGEAWCHGGTLNISFTGPVWSGDTLTMEGTVTTVTADALTLSIRVDAPEGRNVLLGTAHGPYSHGGAAHG